MQQIYLDKSNDSITEEDDEHREDEVYQTAITMLDMARKVSPLAMSQLINNLMKSEPFCSYENLPNKLNQYYSNESV